MHKIGCYLLLNLCSHLCRWGLCYIHALLLLLELLLLLLELNFSLNQERRAEGEGAC